MKQLQQNIGYTFKDEQLLKAAFIHSSYVNENRDKVKESNERLEFLGDSVLGFISAENLFLSNPDTPEGDLSRKRAALVCEKSLFETAKELNFGSYMLLGKGEEMGGGRQRASILADAVEAVIAAMYLDGGIEPARAFVMKHVLSNNADTGDYKTQLQELVQREKEQVLEYRMTGQSGPDHDKRFDFQVLLNGNAVGEGSGKTKKEAEQMAAKAAIANLYQ
ncbi:MAG: ribonuclease III [Ruminococcaceae bacterium]|nr:ribonuclease III [Oscillospiraceae bacterium]